MSEKAWQDWLKTRPKAVQDFAKAHPEYRPGFVISSDKDLLYMMGFSEFEDGGVGIIVTSVNPAVDYKKAKAERQVICGNCLEGTDGHEH